MGRRSRWSSSRAVYDVRVYELLEEIEVAREGRVVAIGVFDGLHLGHQVIVRETVETARQNGSRPMVITFSPHPEAVLKGTRGPRLLTTVEQKAKILSALRVMEMLVVRFDRRFAQLTPEEFCDSVLSERLGVRTVLVGKDFHFGQGGKGTAGTLERLGQMHGFSTTVVPLVEKAGGLVSSTRVRALLSSGDVVGAQELLGRPYRLEGRVTAGSRRGRTLGAPTANMELSAALARPRVGVYVTRAIVDERDSYPSVTSIGTNPTFEQKGRVRAETFLLDFAGDLAGSVLEIEFLRRLRGQRRFPDASRLSTQISEDVKAARQEHRRWSLEGKS